jgi:tetratricopeptide (TPR) repeat protein
LVLDGAGMPAEAEKAYRKVLALNPQNGVALNNLAYLLSRSKPDLDEALSLALRAHEVLPDLYEIDDTLGWINLKRNDPQMAIGWLEPLVEKAPEHSTYHYHLALAYAQKGTKPNAIDQLKKALECNPGQEERDKIKQLLATLQ